MIDLVMKRRCRQQNKTGGLPGAKLAAAAVPGDIAGAAGNANDGVVRRSKVAHRIFAVGVCENDVPSNVRLMENRRVGQALAVCFWHMTEQQFRYCNLPGQGLKMPDLLFSHVHTCVGIGKAGAFCRRNARQTPKSGGVRSAETETAHQPKVIHLLSVHVIVRGVKHVRLGAFEPGVEAYTQSDDRKNSEKTAQGSADAP